MLEFLSDIKASLTTNNPSFSARNVQAITTIASSFRKITLQALSDSIEYIYQMSWALNCIILALVITIKVLEVKLQLAYKEIFKIYTKISQKEIESSL
jgi:hypothetical protein